MSRRSNDLEQRALKIILDAEGGVLQSEMWKKLGVSSREGSRLALKFEEKGFVERRKILHDGRWTYVLHSRRQQVTIESLKGCPCLKCEEIDKCVPGGLMSPVRCGRLTDWIEVVAGGYTRHSG